MYDAVELFWDESQLQCSLQRKVSARMAVVILDYSTLLKLLHVHTVFYRFINPTLIFERTFSRSVDTLNSREHSFQSLTTICM